MENEQQGEPASTNKEYCCSMNQSPPVIKHPNLKRLSHQLRVDFAIEVQGSGDKRKREPTRSIYEEAAANFEKDETRRAARRKRTKHTLVTMRKRQDASDDVKSKGACYGYEEKQKGKDMTQVSEQSSQEEENNSLVMMHAAAASLAQLSKRAGAGGDGGSTANQSASSMAVAMERKMLKAITKAHIETLAAKDEAIKATAAALEAKNELVKMQATVIAMMQQGGITCNHTPSLKGRIATQEKQSTHFPQD